ncbi:MAG: hypothetical protein JNN25_16535 [Candidatus Kapabacteria bacterium]|nr:hypothetical protein [Candidatus Kapabacteria bacterium]
MKFARLFDLEDGNQVLITTEYNEDKDTWAIHQRTEIQSTQATMVIEGFTEVGAEVAMGVFTMELAAEWRAAVEASFPYVYGGAK